MLTAAERKTETKNTETKKVEAKKKPSLRFYLLRDMVGNFSADWVLPEKNWRLAFCSNSHQMLPRMFDICPKETLASIQLL